MTKPLLYSEVDAMRDVDAALSKIADDEQQRVLRWAAAKYGDSSGGQLRLGSDVQSAAKTRDVAQEGTPHIKDFVADKTPGNFYERVACIVYHLEKFQDKSDVENKDVVEANTQARLSRMTNPALFIKHATHTYGYLTSLGSRRFAISRRGEALVEALPDREAVNEALARFPFGKKRKASRKK